MLLLKKKGGGTQICQPSFSCETCFPTQMFFVLCESKNLKVIKRNSTEILNNHIKISKNKHLFTCLPQWVFFVFCKSVFWTNERGWNSLCGTRRASCLREQKIKLICKCMSLNKVGSLWDDGYVFPNIFFNIGFILHWAENRAPIEYK